MNTAERIQYEKEIGLTSGKNYDLLGKTDVNWLDAVYNNAALLQNYELSVSGASDRTNYYISGGYYNQDGIAVGSYFDRYSLRANVEQRAADWLKIGTNTMLNYQGIEQADEGSYTLVTPISAARFMLPYWTRTDPTDRLPRSTTARGRATARTLWSGSRRTAANTRNTSWCRTSSPRPRLSRA